MKNEARNLIWAKGVNLVIGENLEIADNSIKSTYIYLVNDIKGNI